MNITVTRNDTRSYTARVEFPEGKNAAPINITTSTAYEALEAAASQVRMIECGAGIEWPANASA